MQTNKSNLSTKLYERLSQNKSYTQTLFNKGYLVGDSGHAVRDDVVFGTVVALAEQFNVFVRKGLQMADICHVQTVSENIGINVPQPFYKGFPMTVKRMSSEQLLFDQLFHYFQTYGLGNFDEPSYSLFEKDLERVALNPRTEKLERKYFEILTAEDAFVALTNIVNNLLASTRPLNEIQYKLVKQFITDFPANPNLTDKVGSRNTAIKLYIDTQMGGLTLRSLRLPDVIKLVEELNYAHYNSTDIKKLNLRNQDRKLVRQAIDSLIMLADEENALTLYSHLCCEQRKLWKGLLYHIHYTPRNTAQKDFWSIIHQKQNESPMHYAEYYLSEGNISRAVDELICTKGATAVLRMLDRFICSCRTMDEKIQVLTRAFSTNNVPVLLQLYYNYASKKENYDLRTFKFTKFYKLRKHTETPFENRRRKTFLCQSDIHLIAGFVREALKRTLKDLIDVPVYVDEAMRKTALPIQETTGNSGYGILPRGSRKAIDSNVVRLFTYWEKVNDIDISAMAIDKNGKKLAEYSWRYNADFNGRTAITFSGDVTNGFNGGAEYLDVEIEQFKKGCPSARYIIVCDNVYSGIPFNQCVCRAGYMARNEANSGEIFEPKTVRSSFTITSASTFAILCALDLETNEFVWLNTTINHNAQVAGDSDFAYLLPYLESCNILNIYDFVKMCAKTVVDTPEEAEMIFSDDETVQNTYGDTDKSLIRSCDTDVILALINSHGISQKAVRKVEQ